MIKFKVIFSLMCSFMLIRQAFSQTETTMTPIILQAAKKIKTIEDDFNNIVKMEFDLVFEDRKKTSLHKLFSHKSYTLVAFGDDNRILDINLKIHQKKDGEWTVVANNNYSSKEASLRFNPPNTGTYLVEITAPKFKTNHTVGHYGLIVYIN